MSDKEWHVRVRYHGTFIRLGRRSWFLLLYCLAYIGIANSVLINIQLRPNLFIFDYLPDWVRFGIWFTGGIMAGITALLSPKPSQMQTVGFVGLCIPVAVRAVFYGFGLIEAIWNVHDRAQLLSSGVSGIVIYGVMLITIILVAGWPEPGPEDYLLSVRRPPSERDSD